MTKPLTPYTDTAIDMFVVRWIGKRPVVCDGCGIPITGERHVDEDGITLCGQCYEQAQESIAEMRRKEGW